MSEEEERINAEVVAVKGHELAQLAERSGLETGTYLHKMASLEFIQQRKRAGEDPRTRRSIIHVRHAAVIKAAPQRR